MITVSSDLAAILSGGGFSRYFVADVVVDGERVLSDVPLTSCELTSRGNAKIRNQGSAVFSYSDELGTSILPEDITSWLTPYATYLNISMRVSIGDFSEKVLRGSFKIIGVSDPESQRVTVADRLLTLNSKVRLRLADAFAVSDRERFLSPTGPASLDSAWDEIARVTGLAVNRNVADAAINRNIVYDASVLDAAIALGSVLGGVPYMSPLNQVTLQPDEWGDLTEPLNVGPDGTITKVAPDDLTDEGIYNQVVVRSFDTTQQVVLATAEVTDGPLRYGGPFGRIPFFASSEFITNESQAQDYADLMLPKVSSVPATPYMIQCLPDPRREVGDVVPFTKDNEQLVGRISELKLSDSGPMTLKMMVDRDL